jgi:hypothetical protein
MIAWRIHGLRMDDPAVLAKVDQANRRALSRYGNYVRVAARRSIRRRRTPSPPGQPPRSVTGLLKIGIMYGYDPTAKSVVVGAARIAGGTSAPATLEYGGPAGRRKNHPRPRRVGEVGELSIDPRRTPGAQPRKTAAGVQYVRYGRLRTTAQVRRSNAIARRLAAAPAPAMVAPRPYMGPADSAARARLLPRLWQNSIKP